MTTNQVWQQYAEDVKHYIFSKVKNSNITDDLLQETFLKIHIKLYTLKNSSKLKSWVFTIARNITLDYFRTNNKVIEIEAFDSATEFQNDKHCKEDCLPAHIKKLDKKYRTPLFLSDIKGLKQAEIAIQLKLPLSTVKSRIQRARKKVAQGYIDCCGYTLNDDGILVGEDKEMDDCKICN